jgi:hypothetical protein
MGRANFSDGGIEGEYEGGPPGGLVGGIDWSAVTLYFENLADVDAASPADGDIVIYNETLEKWIMVQSGALRFTTETITVDVDFSSSSLEDVTVSLDARIRDVLLGRVSRLRNSWRTCCFIRRRTWNERARWLMTTR